jgi:hypothetical protein
MTWLLFDLCVVAMVVGEWINGFHRARGFDGVLFGCGVAAVGGVYGWRFLSGRAAGRWIKQRIAVVRGELAAVFDAGAGSRSPRWLVGLGLVLAGTVVGGWVWVRSIAPPELSGGEVVLVRELRGFMANGDVCRLSTAINWYSAVVFALARSSDVVHLVAVSKLTIAVCAAGTALLVFWYSAREGGARLALVSVLPLLVFGIQFRAQEDVPLMLAFGFGLVLVLRGAVTAPRLHHCAVVGALAGLGFGTKQSAVLLVLLALVLIAVRTRRTSLVLERAVAFVVPFLALVLPLLLVSEQCEKLVGDMTQIAALAFRGAEVEEMGIAAANQAVDAHAGGLALAPFVNRLTFQTVGELVVGGAKTMLLPLLTFFPYLQLSRRDSSRDALRIFVLICFLFYGVVVWRHGDSASPIYLLAPAGLIAYGPYLRNLVRAIRRLRSMGLLAAMVVVALLLVNAAFAIQVVVKTVSAARGTIEKYEGLAVTDYPTYRLSQPATALLDFLEREDTPVAYDESGICTDYEFFAFNAMMSRERLKTDPLRALIERPGRRAELVAELREWIARFGPRAGSVLAVSEPSREWLERLGEAELRSHEPCARVIYKRASHHPEKYLVVLEFTFDECADGEAERPGSDR